MIVTPSELDFDSIKRFFSFGCSFTYDKWPTWSHLIYKEIKTDTWHHNFGESGAGNLMISNNIMEVDNRVGFNENDLIGVMWSTFCREDRWIRSRGWLHPGNIFSQDVYDNNFVIKFADTVGYLIRDVSLISFSLEYMKSSPAKFMVLMSVPLNYQQDEGDEKVEEILRIYQQRTHILPPSLFDLEMNKKWDCGHSYYSDHHKSIFDDYHPNSLRQWNYLKKLGYKMTKKSKRYAEESTDKLHQTRTEKEIMDLNFNAGIKKLKLF